MYIQLEYADNLVFRSLLQVLKGLNMKKYMLSIALLLSVIAVPAHAVTVNAAIAEVEKVAHSPLGREAIHQILKNLTKEDLLAISNITVVNSDDIAQVLSQVVQQLRDANKSHDVKEVSKTALKTFAREKAIALITAGLEQAAGKAHISRPEFIKQNSRLDYLTTLIYKEALRQAVDSQINTIIK